MGAIASGGVQVPNTEVLQQLGIPAHVVNAVAAREREDLARRERTYRDDRPAPTIAGRTVILVDDGLATGATMRAAAAALRAQHPAHLVAAVPIGAPESCAALRREVDELICVATPAPFFAVGLWYEDFTATTDAEVRTLLAQAERHHPLPHGAASSLDDTLGPGSL
jgi:predicted phosphoribosyltransferase